MPPNDSILLIGCSKLINFGDHTLTHHASFLIISETSFGSRRTSLHVALGITVSSTLLLLIFSSMTCFKQLSASFSASSKLIF